MIVIMNSITFNYKFSKLLIKYLQRTYFVYVVCVELGMDVI